MARWGACQVDGLMRSEGLLVRGLEGMIRSRYLQLRGCWVGFYRFPDFSGWRPEAVEEGMDFAKALLLAVAPVLVAEGFATWRASREREREAFEARLGRAVDTATAGENDDGR